jgi:hypothetical protein
MPKYLKLSVGWVNTDHIRWVRPGRVLSNGDAVTLRIVFVGADKDDGLEVTGDDMGRLLAYLRGAEIPPP